jgi:hypothetical protein
MGRLLWFPEGGCGPRRAKTMDVLIEPHGIATLLRPITPEAETRLREHLWEESMWYKGALVVESRYASGIIEVMKEDGLSIAEEIAHLVPA